MQYINKTKKKPTAPLQKGLTLFELLVVLTILALMATLIAPRVVGYLGRAKSDTAQTQAANIAAALELFYLDLDRYPSLEEGLGALVTPLDGTLTWRGPYLKEASGLIDPWGRTYVYGVSEDGDNFTVTTYGKDGAEGGDGDDTDIVRR